MKVFEGFVELLPKSSTSASPDKSKFEDKNRGAYASRFCGFGLFFYYYDVLIGGGFEPFDELVLAEPLPMVIIHFH